MANKEKKRAKKRPFKRRAEGRPGRERWQRATLRPPGRAQARLSARPAVRLRDEMGNPLAVQFPKGFLSPVQAKRLLSIKREQARMWSWALALSILTFFLISVISIGAYLGWAGPLSPRMEAIIEQADLMAITVFALEFAAQYRKAENKALFFKKNWLGILAILPMGLFMRAASVAEGIGFVRSLQAFVKLEKFELVLPTLQFSKTLRVTVPSTLVSESVLWVQNTLAHFSVFTDFAELAFESVRRILR